MKREDVKNKIPGITEEQLNWLMQENGSDITREKFLSTLSLRRATPTSGILGFYPLISIHALLAESDTWTRGSRITYVISIHALLAESDVCVIQLIESGLVFLSTLSLRRATLNA